jgi:hypothetical protein
MGSTAASLRWAVRSIRVGAAAQTITYNGSGDPFDALSEPSPPIAASNGAVAHVFASWSITLLHLHLDEHDAPSPTFQLHLPAVQNGE